MLASRTGGLIQVTWGLASDFISPDIVDQFAQEDVHWYGLNGTNVWDHALRRCRFHHIRDLLVVLDCWNQKPLIKSQVVSTVHTQKPKVKDD